jgi:predicted  nucleic acid-binding Zn-ribbon protein
METEILTNQETTTQNAETEQAEQKTFTQDDVNRIVAKRVEKYSDYAELKEKAQKFDEQVEAGKSELQKATEKADRLQAELDAIKTEASIRSMREEVATATGVPANLLTASTQEECEAQAQAILSWSQQREPNGYPVIPDGGDPIGNVKKSTKELFKEWFDATV